MKLKSLILVLAASVAPTLSAAYTNIVPGEAWNDKNGSFINAHGSCVFYHEGTYYWFGEDRTGSKSNGISCYTSTDLLNWTRSGLAFKADQAYAPQTKSNILERPKVMYNESTGKWIMYMHWEDGTGYGRACVCVAYADKPQGPYTYSSHFRPNDHDSRDQTIVRAADGSAYHLCATDMNSNINVALLAPDYLTPAGKDFENKTMRGMRLEAPAIIRVDDTYYCLFSECDGWNPTPGHAGWTTDPLGTWVVGENFCVDEKKKTSYATQSTCLFKVNGYDQAYVYVGDRWNKNDVGSSRQVWLPLSLRSGHPVVRWYDSWNLSVFADVDRFRRAAQISEGVNYKLIEKFSDRFAALDGTRIALSDDAEKAISFEFKPVEGKEYTYTISDASTGRRLESYVGNLRMADPTDALDQQWFLQLEEEGTYQIRNLESKKVIAISGASTLNGAALYLTEPGAGKHMSMGLYVDTKTYPTEPVAAMHTIAYREENRRIMAAQQEYIGQTAVESPESALFDYSIADGAVTVTLPADGTVALYTPSGTLAATAQATAGTALSLTAPSGIYILATPMTNIIIRL